MWWGLVDYSWCVSFLKWLILAQLLTLLLSVSIDIILFVLHKIGIVLQSELTQILATYGEPAFLIGSSFNYMLYLLIGKIGKA